MSPTPDPVEPVPSPSFAGGDGFASAFAAAAAEGPFGFKPDRNRPIEPHFDGFGGLTPDQARQVLDVRDGRQSWCVVQLATESVLVEHCGQGYTDPATGARWGYRIRRVGVDVPPPASADPTPADPTSAGPTSVVDPALTAAADPIREPAAVAPRADPQRQPSSAPPPPLGSPPTRVAAAPPDLAVAAAGLAAGAASDADDGYEEADRGVWSAPVRSPRAVTLADPVERAAVVRVLILWLVVALLAVACLTLLAGRR